VAIDINDLKLTDEEMWSSYEEKYVEGNLQAVVDAQLAKVLRGIQVWLTKSHVANQSITGVLIELNTTLMKE